MEKQEKENQKMERKRKREEKREHALKTKKGKGVGKKSKNINKNKENIDIKTETENAKEKNIKTEIETDSKLRILSNIVIVTCDVCRRLADKNKLLLQPPRHTPPHCSHFKLTDSNIESPSLRSSESRGPVTTAVANAMTMSATEGLTCPSTHGAGDSIQVKNSSVWPSPDVARIEPSTRFEDRKL
ncbi:hypothetical protein EVAR_33721_1 [Eumeta japonica]|uniref:Uncharacterized protein n=1 Tax=Eumeta variegata TaxID=151549 RepID=A0A4C1VT91_EUMVA|nr:hypothetical protein EVAR_33721_1 [Eumeta japonica]